LFAIPRHYLNYFEYEGQTVYDKCTTSQESPLQVDKLSFTAEITLPEFPQTYQIQYLLRPDSPRLRRSYRDVIEEARQAGQPLEDLPKVGACYRYVYSQKHNFAHYLATDPKLRDINGDPLVLSECGLETSVLQCNLSFEWHPPLRVYIREIGNSVDRLPK